MSRIIFYHVCMSPRIQNVFNTPPVKQLRKTISNSLSVTLKSHEIYPLPEIISFFSSNDLQPKSFYDWWSEVVDEHIKSMLWAVFSSTGLIW